MTALPRCFSFSHQQSAALALFLIALAPGFAHAQFAAGGVTYYPTKFYAEYDPKTALEFISRTPGFSFQQAGAGRGLAGIRSNVLIDGLRPPPKGQTITSLLAELPADRVARIEVIEAGARPDLDMQGYAQVLNVVTRADPAPFVETILRGSRQGTAKRGNDGNSWGASGRGSIDVGDHEFSGRVSYDAGEQGNPAAIASVDPNDVATRLSQGTRSSTSAFAADANAALSLSEKDSLTINGKYSRNALGSAPAAIGDSASVELLSRRSDSKSDRYSISVEYKTAPASDLELLLSALRTGAASQSVAAFSGGGVDRASVSNTTSAETAGRARLRWTASDHLTLGLEGTAAYNMFQGMTSLEENGAPRPLGNGDAQVSELRGGFGVDADWRPIEDVTVQAALRFESYKLETAAGANQDSIDPAGQLSVTWQPIERTTLSYEGSRNIGQLAFGQFLASSSLESDIVEFGADALQPEFSWSHALTLDHRFNERGVVQLSIERKTVDNPIDLAPISDSIFVSQNVGPQTVDTASADVSMPLDDFGFDGGVFYVNGALSRSLTEDPVTGEHRPVSGAPGDRWGLSLRKDRAGGDFAWGASVSSAGRTAWFNIRSTGEQDGGLGWSGFAEWTGVKDLKLRLSVQGPNDTSRRTFIYGAPRAIGLDPEFVETNMSSRASVLSGSIEWRIRDKVELTFNASSGSRFRSSQLLTPYSEDAGDPFIWTQPGAPSASLQIRLTN